jgi:tellurite methyltransferase
MERAIVGFEQDDEQHWVARLACGHTQHVRHEPPWQARPWVLEPASRAAKIGTSLDCVYCNMPALPANARAYYESAVFDQDSVPAPLLTEHHTKPGVWARIIVEGGKLEYHCAEGVFVLRPGVEGIVAPAVPHHVRLLGEVRFRVVFLRGEDV